MRRMLARIALLCICVVYCLPLTAIAAGQGAPEEPYEKVIAKSGSWYENRMNYDGKSTWWSAIQATMRFAGRDSAFEVSLSEGSINRRLCSL